MAATAPPVEASAPEAAAGSVGTAVTATNSSGATNSASSSMADQTATRAGDLSLDGALLVVSTPGLWSLDSADQ